MEADLIGRVNNLHLPAINALMPLYEAVVNSIQAIEDTKSNNGHIEIKILRGQEVQQSLAVGDRELPPICGFEISDNGVGFDADNLKSFQTSDSRWKETRGGKGIGRLFWLKAFSNVSIDSVFEESGAYFRRNVLRAASWRRRTDQSGRSNRRLSGFDGSFRTRSSSSLGVR